MEKHPLIQASKDYEKLVGLFQIDCGFKMGSTNKVEWHLVGEKHGGGDVNIVIYYYLGQIKVVYGETEYDVLYDDDSFLVGRALYENGEIVQLNIHDILDFMKWDYKLGYV